MARQTIPDDQQFAGNVALQMGEKLDDLPAANGSGKQPDVAHPGSLGPLILASRALSWLPSG